MGLNKGAGADKKKDKPGIILGLSLYMVAPARYAHGAATSSKFRSF